MRILSLDVGEKRIGMALSDELGFIARPLETLHRETENADFEEIKKIAHTMDVTEVVVGLPLNMDGRAGPNAKKAYDFVEKLKKKLKTPVKLWDERLTTLEANRILIKAGMSRKKRKKLDDKLAAQLILQSYLDAKQAGNRSQRTDDR
ncbi:MAG: Holliday junction resolvase RuvX [Candidatus Omnitrophota bacterium]|nr:Holliday junction resolvase RuvX [Candidatus Omnitrophota bacterium]